MGPFLMAVIIFRNITNFKLIFAFLLNAKKTEIRVNRPCEGCSGTHGIAMTTAAILIKLLKYGYHLSQEF